MALTRASLVTERFFTDICAIEPLIWQNAPIVLPIVCQNKPFIRLPCGFTLIELLITIVIVGILAALAAPAMSTIVSNQRLSIQVNDLLSDLAFARSEAVKRSQSVIVCKTSDPNTATPACNTTTAAAWTAGRVVFADIDDDDVIDAGEVLRVRQALEGAASSGNALFGDGAAGGTANRVEFRPNGATTLSPAVGDSENEMLFCDRRGDSAGRTVAIHPLGRARAVPDQGRDMNNNNITACP